MSEADSYAAVASELALAVTPAPLPKGFEESVIEKAIGPNVVSLSSKRRRFNLIPTLSVAAVLLAFIVMATQVVQTRQAIQDQDRVVSALLRGDGDAMELSGNGAVAKMVPTNGGVIFVASGLQEAPSNHTYQLWLLNDGKPESVATFDVSDGVALVRSDFDLSAYDNAAVTIEPEGGSADPSDTVVLSASA